MKKSVDKFLKFKGKIIHYLHIDGQYWIAVRPIIEALGLDNATHQKSLKKHLIWGQLWCAHTMVDANNHFRKMVALPEKYVYGWLFQIKSNNPDLIEYQKECCEVLYNHFHGTITGRRDALMNAAQIKQEKAIIEAELANNEAFQRLKELDNEKKRNDRKLKDLDNQLINEQLSLFNN